jgi:hypothetical protein
MADIAPFWRSAEGTDPIHREGMVGARLPLAFDLADPIWIERTFDQSYANLETMARWGYKWPKNEEGKEYRGRLRGPDVLFFLRNQLKKHQVRILDRSPALELLRDGEGIVVGARRSAADWRDVGDQVGCDRPCHRGNGFPVKNRRRSRQHRR